MSTIIQKSKTRDYYRIEQYDLEKAKVLLYPRAILHKYYDTDNSIFYLVYRDYVKDGAA